MNQDFQYSLDHIKDLDHEQCQEFSREIVMMLAAITYSIDECAPNTIKTKIFKVAWDLLGKD